MNLAALIWILFTSCISELEQLPHMVMQYRTDGKIPLKYIFSRSTCFKNRIWYNFLNFARKTLISFDMWFDQERLQSTVRPRHFTDLDTWISTEFIDNLGYGPMNVFREINIISVLPLSVWIEKPLIFDQLLICLVIE